MISIPKSGAWEQLSQWIITWCDEFLLVWLCSRSRYLTFQPVFFYLGLPHAIGLSCSRDAHVHQWKKKCKKKIPSAQLLTHIVLSFLVVYFWETNGKFSGRRTQHWHVAMHNRCFEVMWKPARVLSSPEYHEQEKKGLRMQGKTFKTVCWVWHVNRKSNNSDIRKSLRGGQRGTCVNDRKFDISLW